MLCPQHYQHFNEEMGCCWKCLAAERDSPNDAGGSWWWHLEPQVLPASEVKEASCWLKKVA